MRYNNHHFGDFSSHFVSCKEMVIIMEDNEFTRQSREAVEKMREMNSRARVDNNGQNMPPAPPFVRLQGKRQGTPPQRQRQSGAPPLENSVPKSKESEANKNSKDSGFLSGLNIPFLDMLSRETDVSLIIGLLLILMSEKADKKLLFALVYILL